MPHSTDQFEYLLDDEGVQAVSYEERDDTVVVFVAEKLPEDELAVERLIRERVSDDHDVDVVEVGEITVGTEGASATAEIDPPVDADREASPNARDRVRPAQAGVSEIRAGSTAATAGLLAEVTDPEDAAAIWADDVEAGDRVRVSNAHVYGGTESHLGATVTQPSPYDGGDPETDAVGRTAGVVPIDDQVVDAAARTLADPDDETYSAFDLGTVPDVRRGEWAQLRGERAVKVGRTTGTTMGRVQATDASVRVRYADGVFTKRHQLLLDDMSAGGDSGSPLLLGTAADPGALLGHVFAGSDRVTVANRTSTIERRLGVEFRTDPEDHEPEETIEDRVERYFSQEYGPENVQRQYIFSNSRRRVDLLVDVGAITLTVEVEAGSAKMIEGLGQSLVYAAHDVEDGERGPYVPMIVMPDDHYQQPERRYADHHVSILEESELRDRLGIEDDRDQEGEDQEGTDDQDDADQEVAAESVAEGRDLSTMTVPEVEDYLDDLPLSPDTLDMLADRERAGKDRKGVYEAIERQRSEVAPEDQDQDQDPAPDPDPDGDDQGEDQGDSS